MHLHNGCKISQTFSSHQQTSIGRHTDHEMERLTAVWTADGLTLLIPHKTCLWYELAFDSKIRSSPKTIVRNNTSQLSGLNFALLQWPGHQPYLHLPPAFIFSIHLRERQEVYPHSDYNEICWRLSGKSHPEVQISGWITVNQCLVGY